MSLRLVYDSHPLTIGANTELATAQPNWVRVPNNSSAGSTLNQQTDGTIRQPVNFDATHYRWTGCTLVDQRIEVDFDVANGTPFLSVRNDANGNRYDGQWSPGDNFITIQRTTNNGVDHAFLNTPGSGTVAASVAFRRAFMQAVTLDANTVRVTFGDDRNGSFTYDDTDAARFLSGQPGVGIYNNVANTCAIIRIRIYAVGAAGSRIGAVAAASQRRG